MRYFSLQLSCSLREKVRQKSYLFGKDQVQHESGLIRLDEDQISNNQIRFRSGNMSEEDQIWCNMNTAHHNNYINIVWYIILFICYHLCSQTPYYHDIAATCSETVLFLHQIFLKGLTARMDNWPTLVIGE